MVCDVGVEIDTLVEGKITDLGLLDKRGLLDKCIDLLDEVVRDIQNLGWCQDLVNDGGWLE
jgi:hypothetical protein